MGGRRFLPYSRRATVMSFPRRRESCLLLPCLDGQITTVFGRTYPILPGRKQVTGSAGFAVG